MVGQIIRHLGTVLAMVSPIAITACGEDGNARPEGADTNPERIANVVTTEVTPRSFTNYLNLVGEIRAWQRVSVTIEEVGIIERLAVEKGQEVKKGTLLARLKDDLLQATAKEAEASLNISKLNLNNQKRLFAEQAAAESAYLESQYQHDIAQARYDLATARLAKMVIRAPLSGVVDTRELEEGELATAARAFMDIVDIDRVKVVAGLPERHLRHVQINTGVTIAFPAYPDLSVEGQISFIGTTIDKDNRTVPVEIILANPEHHLKPEMAALIRVVRDHIPEAFVVPQDAVVDTDQGMMVFVAEGSIARSVPVTLGPISQDQVVVLDGIQSGMALITLGHRDLVDGEPIRVRTE